MFNFFKTKHLPQNLINNIEETLLHADFGVTNTQSIINKIKKLNVSQQTSHTELNLIIKNILLEEYKSLDNTLNANEKLNIFSFVGLNGSGKTTTIAKFAYLFKNLGYKVLLIPADTFRAGAKEQLNLWANELGVDFFNSSQPNASSSTMVYLGIEYALKNSYNVVLVDTSGRLDNNSALLDELTKIQNTIKKLQPSFANNILVLDATLGSYSINIAENFSKAVDLAGLIITKLDGVAKGGFVFNLMNKIKKPVYFIGTGEGKENFEKFNLEKYIDNLLK